MHYFKKYKKIIALLILSAIFIAFSNSFAPYLFGKLVDLVLGQTEFFGLAFWHVIGIWIVIELIALVLNEWQGYKGVNTQIKVERDITVDLCEHSVNLPVKYHYDKKPGEIFKIIDRTTNANYRIFENFTFILLPNILMMLAAFVIMFYTSWILALIILVTVLLYFVLSIYFRMDKILANQRKLNKKFNKLYGSIGDMLANIFAVKVNTAEKHEIRDRRKSFGGIIKTLKQQMIYWVQYGLLQGFIVRSSYVIVIVLAIYLLAEGQLTPGGLAMFVAYLAMIYQPLWFITSNIREIRRRLVDVEDAIRIKKQEWEKEYRGAKVYDLKGEVEFKNVYFSYPEREAGILAGINFRIDSGKTLAIFGETGSGKTTIYNLILRLYEPDSGQILFDGIDSRKITLNSLRSQIAVVPQDPILFNESIFDNILYSRREAKKNEVIRAAKVANAHDFIMKLPKGYQTKVGERGVKLSGGQVQRIAIARAVLQDPEILILDEATSSLDQKTKFEVLDALWKLIRGRTTIIITHDFSSITTNADNIIVLDNGRVVQKGNHRQLLKKRGIYKNLYQTQQEHLV